MVLASLRQSQNFEMPAGSWLITAFAKPNLLICHRQRSTKPTKMRKQKQKSSSSRTTALRLQHVSMKTHIGDLSGSVRNDGLPANLSSNKKKYLPDLIGIKKGRDRKSRTCIPD